VTLSLADRVRRLPVVRTARLELVPPNSIYAPALVDLLSDRSISRWTGTIPYPYTSRDADEYIRRARATRRAGGGVPFHIVRRSDGVLIGGAGLHNLNEARASAEAGYWLGRKYRGQGYAREALAGVLGTAFGTLGLHRVYATVFPRNGPSIRVLRSNGFQYEGRIRDEIRKDGEWRSALLFSRLSTDPPLRTPTGRRGASERHRQRRPGRTR
jgi:[ribosomal protein S5]-alanine N-acetyltransferase